MTQDTPERTRARRALMAMAGAGLAGMMLAAPVHAQSESKQDGAAAQAEQAAQDGAAAAAPGRSAQDAIRDPQTIATVGGEPITDADLALSAQDLAETIANYPDDQKAGIVMNFLINQKLMAQAAGKEDLEETDEYRQRMALLRDRTLRDLYFQRVIAESVNEEDVRKVYDETAEKIAGEQEVRARHILVESEEEAKEIHAALEDGGNFEELAKEKSIDPSAENGGDLGFFGKGDMVAPFAEAAFALETGTYSEPVQTEFGWHVIKAEEKRDRTPPPFEQVQEQIAQNLVRTRYFELIEELKQDTEIDIVGEDAGAEDGDAADAPAGGGDEAAD